MDIHTALTTARSDIARLQRYVDRRDRFLDALDWTMLSETLARENSMLDDLLADDLADGRLYLDWLEGQLADDVADVVGVLRFDPRPRPWHSEWITLAA